MEKRVMEEVKLYKLVMNPVTANAETGNIVAISTEIERLEYFLKEQESLFPFRDASGYVHFYKEGPLYWYNQPTFGSCWGHGIQSEWVYVETYNELRNSGQFLFI